jgi:hypothetical protein
MLCLLSGRPAEVPDFLIISAVDKTLLFSMDQQLCSFGKVCSRGFVVKAWLSPDGAGAISNVSLGWSSEAGRSPASWGSPRDPWDGIFPVGLFLLETTGAGLHRV